jgi:hypothetical protein
LTERIIEPLNRLINEFRPIFDYSDTVPLFFRRFEDANYYTPVHYVIDQDDPELLQYLIDRRFPLSYSSEQVAELNLGLTEDAIPEPPLIYAANRGKRTAALALWKAIRGYLPIENIEGYDLLTEDNFHFRFYLFVS